MYLKSIEIAGFKSFAKKVALDFKTPITAIVGPNGSGKSNAAEAFRFVLGEQSIKSLRGKRGEDLIFNGSADAGKLNRAGVKVVFDNSARLFAIDFDEVTLERVVHRDSSNEYLINGSQVRLRDIAELLAGAHIGASGHHIISQGEADRILNANIRERREMIEEALGLKVYQYKKIESIRKLEKTQQNIKDVESLKREIAPHLKFLKKQVEKVEKVIEMKESLRGLYKEYFKREDLYLKFTRKKIEEDLRAPTHELSRLENELTRAKEILTNSKNKDAKSDEIIAIEGELTQLRIKRDNITREIGRIEGESFSLERVIQKERDRQNSEAQKTLYFKDVELLIKRVDVFLEEGERETDIGVMKMVLNKIKTILREFVTNNKGSDLNTNIVEHEKEIKRLKNQKDSLDKELVSIDNEIEKYSRQYKTLQTSIEKEKDSNRDAEKDVFRIMASQNELHGIVNSLRAQEKILLHEEEAFKRELAEAYMLVGRESSDYASLTFPIEESRLSQEERRKAIEKIKIRLEDSGAGNSTEIMKEYKEVEERDAFLERELADLNTGAVSLEGLIKELDIRLDTEFKNGIIKINIQFEHFFKLMFGGGNASLMIVREKKRKKKDTDLSELLNDSLDESLEVDEEGFEGVEISVSLPRKKIKGLEMLSGGERALTSIALLFAISQVNPPPFIILDETDAALDEANSRKYGDMIENLSHYSQLILITHNRETMSRAGVLYGVTMGSGGDSRLLSIQFEDAIKVAK
ncbi:MAG: hypothetical protein EXS50_02195 [Candidatus Taylorbacteria bacterium]|nr:hypothetical protein [Candidatus Taylorbacteria bacterium]